MLLQSAEAAKPQDRSVAEEQLNRRSDRGSAGFDAAVALLLTLVALAASCIPARRAMGVDRKVALRHESSGELR